MNIFGENYKPVTTCHASDTYEVMLIKMLSVLEQDDSVNSLILKLHCATLSAALHLKLYTFSDHKRRVKC